LRPSATRITICAGHRDVAFVSEWLVGTLEFVTESLGLSELFVGAFLIAMIGNAAEHSAAVEIAIDSSVYR
jgi:Ca2+:H+ antiporter